MKKLNKYAVLVVLSMWSLTSQAMTVWAVESGQDPFSNLQNSLALSMGTTTLDLYYDVDGDTSYGYEFLLNVTGAGSVANVSGGDSGLGNLTDSGWLQFGGPVTGENGSSILAFSFDFIAESNATLQLSGVYTNANFLEMAVPATTLATVSAVPLPAAAWLFLSGLGLIGFTAKKKK